MNLNTISQLEAFVPNGMTKFQMQNFVVNDSITPYRKLRQAVMEARTRLEVLAMAEFDKQEHEIKLEKARTELNELSGFDRRLKEVEVKRMEYMKNRTETTYQQQNFEVEFFLNAIENIVQELGGIEKAIELLSDETTNYAADQEYWIERLGRSVFSDFVNFGTITKGVVESVSCLTDDQQKQIIHKALSRQLTMTQMLDRTRDNMLVNRD